MGLVFSEMLGGIYLLGREGTESSMKIVHFSQIFPYFFFNISFYAITQKCHLQQFWAPPKTQALDNYMKAYTEKFFIIIPANEKLT